MAQKAIGSGLAWYTGWTFHGQEEIARLQIPHDENQKFPPAISQLQNRIEWLMVQAAERSGLIDIRWQSRVEAITQSDNKAELSITTPAGNYRLHSDWVVIVKDQQILFAGESSKAPEIETDRVITLEGQTLLPGLIEGHSHILLHPYNETL